MASQPAGTASHTKSIPKRGAQIKATENQITKMAMATGVGDDQLRPALQRIALSTGDLSKAQDLLAVAKHHWEIGCSFVIEVCKFLQIETPKGCNNMIFSELI